MGIHVQGFTTGKETLDSGPVSDAKEPKEPDVLAAACLPHPERKFLLSVMLLFFFPVLILGIKKIYW